jgi:hypothetical protein
VFVVEPLKAPFCAGIELSRTDRLVDLITDKTEVNAVMAELQKNARVVLRGRRVGGLIPLPAGQTDLDFPRRNLGVFFLAHKVKLGRANVTVVVEFPHLVHGRAVADGVVDRRLP